MKGKIRTAIIADLLVMLVIGIIGVVITDISIRMILLLFEMVFAVDVIAACKFLKKLK